MLEEICMPDKMVTQGEMCMPDRMVIQEETCMLDKMGILKARVTLEVMFSWDDFLYSNMKWEREDTGVVMKGKRLQDEATHLY